MNSKRLLILPVSDEATASTRYRVAAHLPALQAAGFDTTVRYPRERGLRGPRRLAVRGLDLLRGPYEDGAILLLQRRIFPAALAARLRRLKGPVLFDMDDAIDLPPPGTTAGSAGRRRYRRNFEATVNAARLVLCGNRYLAGRLPHDRFEILPTPIDTERFAPGALPEPQRPAAGPPLAPALGWVGHSNNLPFLEELAEPLREVARHHPGLRLIVVADRPPKLPEVAGLEVEFRRWSLEEEVSGFAGINIGLMPMREDPWTLGKCAFKAIQYMSLGIPTVASPVGMNCEVIRDGQNGFLPADAEGWVRALDALLSDRELAAKLGREGRLTVERDYSLRKTSARLVEILSRF